MKLPDLTTPPKHGRKRPKNQTVKRETLNLCVLLIDRYGNL